MEKINRLGWADGISFNAYGVKVGVRVTAAETLQDVIRHLPPGWKRTTTQRVERLYSLVVGGPSSRQGVRRLNLLYGDLIRLARTGDLDQILDTLESDLQLFVAETSRRRLFVHSGVIGWRDRAILIPGRSFSGKTTLVKDFLNAGATYYSDEYAVIDSRGLVHPFARPLGIRAPGSDAQTRCPVEELGGKEGLRPLQVGLVVVTDFKDGAKWLPRKLTEGQGALELLAHAVSARRQPQTALSRLQKVVASAPVFKSPRGDSQEVVEWAITLVTKNKAEMSKKLSRRPTAEPTPRRKL